MPIVKNPSLVNRIMSRELLAKCNDVGFYGHSKHKKQHILRMSYSYSTISEISRLHNIDVTAEICEMYFYELICALIKANLMVSEIDIQQVYDINSFEPRLMLTAKCYRAFKLRTKEELIPIRNQFMSATGKPL